MLVVAAKWKGKEGHDVFLMVSPALSKDPKAKYRMIHFRKVRYSEWFCNRIIVKTKGYVWVPRSVMASCWPWGIPCFNKIK